MGCEDRDGHGKADGLAEVHLQESSIVDLKKVEAELGSNFEIIMEVSPVNEHESKGIIERAVQTVGGMIWTHTLALD